MIIDFLSDLHGHFPVLEGGDLLVLAGDYTASDKLDQWKSFFDWLKTQKYRKKVFISGNHDVQSMTQFDWGDAEYLLDSGTEFEGLTIWGSPWTKKFWGQNPRCMAFSLDLEEQLEDKWNLIPSDVDILVTHTPPYDILDKSSRIQRCGSPSLLHRIEKIGPQIHAFGHIHEGHGQLGTEDTLFINASFVDCKYRPDNKPVRIEL